MGRRSHSANHRSNNDESPLARADLARLRQAVYRLFSQSLLYPDEGRLENISAVAQGMNRQGEVWVGFAFFPEWSQFLCSLEGLRYQDPAAVQGEYVSEFVVNRAGIPCPIYESAYLGEDPSAKGWLLAQLEGEYAQVGLSPSPALREPPDHAAVELEFMAFLCSCEAEAWEEKDLPKALRECQRQRTFLERHLAWWFPQFACKVAATNRDSVFATAARATTAFLAHDSDLVDALLQQLEGVREAS